MDERHMPDRRAFLRSAALGGFATGGVIGLGLDLDQARAEVRQLKISGGREVPSICPYCAVGCGQLVTAKEGRIVNIEGNPESPISTINITNSTQSTASTILLPTIERSAGLSKTLRLL